MNAGQKPPIILRNSEGFATVVSVIFTLLGAPTFVKVTSAFVAGIIADSYSGDWAAWAFILYKLAAFPLIFYSVRSVIATALLSWSMRVALRAARR